MERKISKRNSWTRLVVWIDHEDWTDDDTHDAAQAVGDCLEREGSSAVLQCLDRDRVTWSGPLVYGWDQDSPLPDSIVVDVPSGLDHLPVLQQVIATLSPLVLDRLDESGDEVIQYEVWRSVAAGSSGPLGVLDRLADIPTGEAAS